MSFSVVHYLFLNKVYHGEIQVIINTYSTAKNWYFEGLTIKIFKG